MAEKEIRLVGKGSKGRHEQEERKERPRKYRMTWRGKAMNKNEVKYETEKDC